MGLFADKVVLWACMCRGSEDGWMFLEDLVSLIPSRLVDAGTLMMEFPF